MVHEVFADVIADPPEDMHNWGPLLLNATDRRAQRRVEQGDRDRDLFEDPEEDVASIALRRLHADETRRRLVRVMGYMTELQREVTHLRLFEGRTSSSNISQIVIRCLTKLQPGLVQLDDIDDGDMANLRPPRRLR